MKSTVLKKVTKSMVKKAFATDEGMDLLVDKMLILVQCNENFESQVLQLLRQVEQLNKNVRILTEENAQLQQVIDELLP